MIWIYFIAVAAVIVFAGAKLTVLAEKLAKLLNISSSVIGLLLVSIITSLPELATSLSAVLKLGEPNLAVGNTLGSDLFNLMIIALCDVLLRRKGLLRGVATHIAPLLYYLFMLTVILLTLTLPNQIVILGAHFNIGSLLVIALYLFTFFKTHRDGQLPVLEGTEPPDRSELRKTAILFSIAAAAIVISGALLAQLGDRIAEQTGLGHSFVGTLFLAIATSLPELTVSISALRIGAVELMLGNILGSNMFNVFISAIADLAYRKEAFHIPDSIAPGLLLIGGCSATMVCIALLATRQKKKAHLLAWESVVMLGIYAAGLFALYQISI